MSARLALLSDGPRRLLALAVAALSVVIPALLVWISVAGVAERWSARAMLAEETSSLRAALNERSEGPAGAGVSPNAGAADAVLIQRAEALADALEAQGASVLQLSSPEGVSARGVAERRLTLTAAGAPAGVAAALSAAAADPGLAVSFAEFDAPRDGAVQVRLVLVEVLAEAQP
jgi:hypothetical protein